MPPDMICGAACRVKMDMAETEDYLKSRFRERKGDYQPSLVAAHWIETAFRMGTMIPISDFTGGNRLREKTMTYDPL